MSFDAQVRPANIHLVVLPPTPLTPISGDYFSVAVGEPAAPAGGAAPAVSAAATPASSSRAASAAPAETAKARQDAATLADVRKKGVYAWAQDQKFQGLAAKVRAQVLADRKLDQATLSALDPAERGPAEAAVQEETTRRIRQAMQARLEAQAQAAAKAGKPPAAQVIDVSI